MECPIRVSAFVTWWIAEVHASKADVLRPKPHREVKHVMQDAVPAIHGKFMILDLFLGLPHQLSVVMIPSHHDAALVRPRMVEIGTRRQRAYEIGTSGRLRSE